MTLNTTECTDGKLEKYVSRLEGPANRSKKAIIDVLEKSVKRFQDQEKSVLDEEKSLFIKKKEKVSKDLEVLKVLSEDDIVRYALSKLDKIMKIATNKRVPREERLKARVAAHKPLSTHLTQFKKKLGTAQEETESGSEDEQDNNGRIVNNTVVLMRKDVKRAKIHVIHKLTRKIKALRAAKGNEDRVAKNQLNAERLGKKVIHIKELDEDEISKFALTTTQNLSQLANDLKAPSISQALATVALNKFVATHVEDFKTKYPNWQKIVPKLLKKKKKRKLSLESNDVENTKRNRSQANVESEHRQPGNESDDDSKCEKGDESDDDSRSENGDETDDSESEVEKKSAAEKSLTVYCENGENSNDSDGELSNSRENNESVQNRSEKDSSNIKSHLEDLKNVKKTPKEFQKAIAKNKLRKTKNEVKETSLSSPQVEAHATKKKPKVIDPFFVTTTNEEYVTNQVPLSGENYLRKNNNHEVNKSGKLTTLSNFDHKKQWEGTSSEGKNGKFKRFQGFPSYKKPTPSNFDNSFAGPKTDKLVFGNRKERRKALRQPQVEEKPEKLHPSWEAKKKQSSIIPFQGKKVKFD